jgi:Flp pilus assembly protein CpaB
VVAAAVGAFAVTNDDGETPLPLRAVAGRSIAPGERLTAADVRLAPAALPAHETALFDGVDALEGATALAPLDEGDLVQRSAVRDPMTPGGRDAHEVAVRLGTAQALAGRLRPGERVDVLATFGTGADAETGRVAQAAVVLGVDPVEGLGGGSGELVVTLAVPFGGSALDVTHAAVAGTLTLVRAPEGTGDEASPEPDIARPEADVAPEGP